MRIGGLGVVVGCNVSGVGFKRTILTNRDVHVMTDLRSLRGLHNMTGTRVGFAVRVGSRPGGTLRNVTVFLCCFG